MTTRQFHFSLAVGVALALAGAIIIGKASVGYSLIALGAGIAMLAVFTRITNGKVQPAHAGTATNRANTAIHTYPTRALAE